MKRIQALCAGVLAAALAGTATAAVHAGSNYTVLDGFAFDIQNGGAVIHAYDGRSTDVVIPDTLMGAPVVRIDNSAFSGNTSLCSLGFNSTQLTAIGDSAFYGCTGLASVEIPDSVTTLGFAAFQNCAGLTEVLLGSGLSGVEMQCFYNCDGLTEVEIPAGMTGIDAYAFGGCDALHSVIIPDSVTSIDDTAFDGSNALTIYCYTGSYAQSFAVAQNIPYVLLDGALKGDADGNGKINIADVTAIQRHLADIEPLRSVSLYFADVDGDGSVTVLDATEIQRYLAEFIEAL